MTTRVYLPATLELLGRWHADRTVPASAERFVAGEADEEAEYAALVAAGEASAELAGTDGRRVVVVGEAADEDAALPWSDVVAVHADPDGSGGRPRPDDDLAWYATQEVPALLG